MRNVRFELTRAMHPLDLKSNPLDHSGNCACKPRVSYQSFNTSWKQPSYKDPHYNDKMHGTGPNRIRTDDLVICSRPLYS